MSSSTYPPHTSKPERSRATNGRRGRILLFSYAFPPMHVQMTAAVFKPMAALVRAGFGVDVVCADSFSPHLPLDDSLLPFAQAVFPHVHRLRPPGGWRGALQKRSRLASNVPDLMTVLRHPAFEHLMDRDLSVYSAVMTWSPFHSINAVMAAVKKQRPNVRWIAQFSDPWAGNPLEVNRFCKWWNVRHEPDTVARADFIVHSSAYSLDLMMNRYPQRSRSNTAVLPHVFNTDLYPVRPKFTRDRILLRYVGVLYGRRSPEPVFLALGKLHQRRPDLRGRLQLELVGPVPDAMLKTPAALSLPAGCLTTIPHVQYIESLALMHDADILLLIEADIKRNLFLPSKLADYMGANRPIVGLVPPGSSEDALKDLDALYAQPSDIDGISTAIERAVDRFLAAPDHPWCREHVRAAFDGEYVSEKYAAIVDGNGQR